MERLLPKSERLHGQKAIDKLFSEGEKWQNYPMRFILLHEPMPTPGIQMSVLISVPKRNFKHAHDRNRIKRQIREAYRINKSQILKEYPFSTDDRGINLKLGILYTARIAESWELVEKKVRKSLEEIRLRLCNNNLEGNSKTSLPPSVPNPS
jgi:ribonuclease P protein component